MLFHIDFGENMCYRSLFVDDESDPFGKKTTDPQHTIGSCNVFAVKRIVYAFEQTISFC